MSTTVWHRKRQVQIQEKRKENLRRGARAKELERETEVLLGRIRGCGVVRKGVRKKEAEIKQREDDIRLK